MKPMLAEAVEPEQDEVLAERFMLKPERRKSS